MVTFLEDSQSMMRFFATFTAVLFARSAAAPWSARSEHAAVTLQSGSIVLMGGQSAAGSLNDVWRTVDGGSSWTQLPARSRALRLIKWAAVGLRERD